MRRDRNLPAGFYPSEPLIKPEEWQNIINYYTATAPDSLPPQQRTFPIKNDLAIFSISAPVDYGNQSGNLPRKGGHGSISPQYITK